MRESFSDTDLQIRLALLGLVSLISTAAAQYFVFAGLEIEIGFGVALVVVAVGVAAGVVTGTPGGLATTEAAMIAAYTELGLTPVDAAAGTLLYRGLHYLVVLVLGLPGWLYCELSIPAGIRDRDQASGYDRASCGLGQPHDRL